MVLAGARGETEASVAKGMRCFAGAKGGEVDMMHQTEVDVALPRFKTESDSRSNPPSPIWEWKISLPEPT